MSVASTDVATGKPTFNDTSTTQADLQAAANYAESVGWRRRDTAAARAALGGSVANGFEFYETDTGITWLRVGGAWTILHQPWTDFTPSTTGFNIGGSGASLREAKYQIENGQCEVRIGWVLGASPTIGDVVISYPVAIASWLPDLSDIGKTIYYDQSAITLGRIAGTAYKTSSGIRLLAYGTGMVTGALGSSTPFAWTGGDEIHVSARYPI